jgi:hypothetical protein
MATFQGLVETVENYFRFAERFHDLVDHLQREDSSIAVLRVAWRERSHNTAHFAFLDVPARMRFCVVRLNEELMGWVSVERLTEDGKVDHLVGGAHFDEMGYVYLHKPMQDGLLVNDPVHLQDIAAHLFGPLLG